MLYFLLITSYSDNLFLELVAVDIVLHINGF